MELSPSESGQILSVAVPRPLDGLFTYRLPAKLAPLVRVGGWVKVPFGRGTTHAFIVESPQPESRIPAGLDPSALKEILEVGEEGAILTDDVLALCKWAHEYYFAPLGEILNCAAPPAAMGLRSARREARPLDAQALTAVASHPLTPDQKVALETLENLRASEQPLKVGVLHGVTGSGKTEVYIEMAKKVLAEGKSVLLLVPEIALTSQLHRRFEQSLGVPVALWHSAVADGMRRDLSAAIRSGEIRVVVGARSAVFAPLTKLGLIVIDEEHDPTYKQEDRFRYHARDLAIVRAKLGGACVVLGSATPSLETRERVREGKYAIARLPQPIAAAGLASIDIVDLCEDERVEGIQAPLAKRTLEAIRETLLAGDQAIVFLNRRGFASFLVCQDCGDAKGCPNCSISLTVHRKIRQLRCHVCDHREPIPDFCGKCQGSELQAMGAGTESLEEELPPLIPEMIPVRLDRDQVTSATRLEKILDGFRAGESNVLLGTQMLVKGHDFPRVTLVVVVMADALFRFPDFRAAERAYQVLRQVAGRAGRGERPGRVLIQTFDTSHPVIQAVLGTLPEVNFLENERELRKLLQYPPFGRMARIRFESAERDVARERAGEAVRALTQLVGDKPKLEAIQILGPSEAFLERAKGIFRWDILLKSKEVQELHRSILAVRALSLSRKWPYLVDVDPYGVG